jgi:two-component system sensor histidine kinase CpxA
MLRFAAFRLVLDPRYVRAAGADVTIVRGSGDWRKDDPVYRSMKMGRLFVRVFLWFWLGSSALIIVLGLTLAVALPDAVATWRFIGRTAMRYLGSEMADAYEREGVAAAQAMAVSAGQEGRFRVWLYSRDGLPLAGPAPPSGSGEAVARAIAEDDTGRLAVGDPPLLARRVTSESGAQYVVMWDAPGALRAAFQPSPLRFVLRLAALLLVGGAVCWLLVWQITKPIRTLQVAARRFADGDLAVRVSSHHELQRGDELTQLAREFDRMASRIQELVTSQQRLLADISHELRSPLARLSLALDLARRRLGEAAPEHDRIEREVQRLDELIEQLLTLARLQVRHEQPLEPVDLQELVRDVARDASFEARAANREVEVSAECHATVRGIRHLLRSGIENVVRNAVRHTAEHTTVSISLACDEASGKVAIIVHDRGPGVPPDALERLFDPFFRVDDARDRERGGVGLGLAIARQAMAAHGGTARAENDATSGLVVRLELPRQEIVDGRDSNRMNPGADVNG